MIRIKVTREKFDEVFSIDEWLNFEELTDRQFYAKMLQFVVDEKGEPVTIEQARAMFAKVPKTEWGSYVSEFAQSVRDAFVNPTSAGTSGEQLSAEQPVPPDGSEDSTEPGDSLPG